jgi:glycosyltransferase involved in cell wall biosynthesis
VNILHLIPTLEGGGAERQLALLAQYGAECNYQVHIACRRLPTTLGYNNNHGNINIHLLGDYRSLDPRLFWSIYKVIKNVNPDIIQTWLLQMDIVGGILSIITQVPWLLTERSSRVFYKKYWPLSKVRLFLGNKANYIIANSHQGVDYWVTNRHLKNPIKQIPNIVDLEAIVSAKKLNISKNNNDEIILLSVGRLIESKGVDVFIRALQMLTRTNSITALIIGDGPEEANLKVLIKDLDLEEIVQILPFTRDWWGYLKHANALISMSEVEGMPNVVLEAMAGMCPLIVSDIQEHRDLLGNNSSLLVHPNNPQMLASSIQTLLSDQEATKKRTKAALSIVSKLDIETIGKSYSQVYKQIVI